MKKYKLQINDFYVSLKKNLIIRDYIISINVDDSLKKNIKQMKIYSDKFYVIYNIYKRIEK